MTARRLLLVGTGIGSFSSLVEDDVALGWINVMTYGALGDGATDDTAAINSAISVVNTAGRGVLYFPPGDYLVSGALTTFTAPAVVRGSGAGLSSVSRITQTSSTAHTFTFTINGSRAQDICGFRSGAASSAGSFFRVTDGDYATFENVGATGFWINVDIDNCYMWRMSGCYLNDAVKYNLRAGNTATPDGGDWSVEGSWFSKGGGAAQDAHVRWESGGGGKFVNCKFNGDPTLTTYGIDAAFPTAVQTSVMTVVGCSIENVSGDGIRVTTTGTARFGLIAITGLQVGLYTNNTGRAINLSAASTGGIGSNGGIGGVVIDACSFRTNGTARAALALTKTDNVELGDIALTGFNARYVGSSDTNTHDNEP